MESHSNNHIDAIFAHLRGLAVMPPSDIRERLDLLRELKTVVRTSSIEICEAVHADFSKSGVEAELTEIATVLLELRSALSNLGRWTSPRRIRAGFPFWTTRSQVITRPKGIVLIISPWNYPVLLSLAPVISAIAAGN
ncbi:MAG: aldehyde dehydrogenase family protein, partial [Rhodothermia bacterium]